MVAVVEGDDRRPAGGVPRDLHGVLDGLRAGVEQGRALLVVAGSERVELLADLRRTPRRALTMKQVCVNRLICSVTASMTRWLPLPTVVDRDARAEVDELVAVGVAHDAARPSAT